MGSNPTPPSKIHQLGDSCVLISAATAAAGDISSSLTGTDNYKKCKAVFDRASQKLIDDGGRFHICRWVGKVPIV